MNRQAWLLKRNCSLAPRQLGTAFLVLCIATLGVGGFFLLHGIWMVVVFSASEMMATAVAFLVYARHATDHEYIALHEGSLLIDQAEAGRRRQLRLDPCCAQITAPDRYGDLIKIEARGMKVEVGRHITHERREQVAQELRRSLHSGALHAEAGNLVARFGPAVE